MNKGEWVEGSSDLQKRIMTALEKSGSQGFKPLNAQL